jgi:hypothetical protein
MVWNLESRQDRRYLWSIWERLLGIEVGYPSIVQLSDANRRVAGTGHIAILWVGIVRMQRASFWNGQLHACADERPGPASGFALHGPHRHAV